MKRSVLLPAMLALLPLATANAQGGPPQDISIKFDGSTAVVTGLTPKADVAWIGIGHVVEDAYLTTVSDHGLDAADALGSLVIDTKRSIPDASVWVVIDLQTGNVAFSSPTPSLGRAKNLPPGLIQKQTGKPDALNEGRSTVEVFVARKAQGMWTLWLADGGERDLDGPGNRAVTVPMNDLEPVGKSPNSPEQLVADDVVVVIDPQQLDLEIGKVKP